MVVFLGGEWFVLCGVGFFSVFFFFVVVTGLFGFGLFFFPPALSVALYHSVFFLIYAPLLDRLALCDML